MFGIGSSSNRVYGFSDCRPNGTLLRCRYAAVVGAIIIVAVWTTDRGWAAIIAGDVISARGGSADRSSTYRVATDADRHSGAYTTVVATTVTPPR